ncbi:uncharacterized protein V6R79_016117 [Siganus canaliculatus]
MPLECDMHQFDFVSSVTDLRRFLLRKHELKTTLITLRGSAPDQQSLDQQSPDQQSPDQQSPDQQSPDQQSPDQQSQSSTNSR